MNIYTQEEEREIIEENTSYVLGMYDLYRSDREIIQLLNLKGISGHLISRILHRIKLPAYEKRIKQSKKMMVMGGSLTLLFVIIYLVLGNLPGSDNFLKPKDTRDSIFIFYFKLYRELFYFTFFVFVLQFIIGVRWYNKYTKLLKEEACKPASDYN